MEESEIEEWEKSKSMFGCCWWLRVWPRVVDEVQLCLYHQDRVVI